MVLDSADWNYSVDSGKVSFDDFTIREYDP